MDLHATSSTNSAWKGRNSAKNEGQDLYFFKGNFRTDKDILDRKTQSGAFVPIAKRIRDDAAQLRATWPLDGPCARARQYKLEELSGGISRQDQGKTKDWVIDLLDWPMSMRTGWKLKISPASIWWTSSAPHLSKHFQIYGDSDEAYRIKGGSSTLIKALVDALKHKIEMNLGYALTELDYQDGQIVMSFDAPGGTYSSVPSMQ